MNKFQNLNLNGKGAIITGGGSGIGRATALTLDQLIIVK